MSEIDLTIDEKEARRIVAGVLRGLIADLEKEPREILAELSEASLPWSLNVEWDLIAGQRPANRLDSLRALSLELQGLKRRVAVELEAPRTLRYLAINGKYFRPVDSERGFIVAGELRALCIYDPPRASKGPRKMVITQIYKPGGSRAALIGYRADDKKKKPKTVYFSNLRPWPEGE